MRALQTVEVDDDTQEAACPDWRSDVQQNATGNEAGKAARYASLTYPADSAGSRRTRPALSRCSHFASMLAASDAEMPNR